MRITKWLIFFNILEGDDENMIVSRIIGGLGNQMFQYAIARSISIRNSIPLYLDLSGFKNYGRHQGFQFEQIFDIKYHIATINTLREVLGWQSTPLVRRVLARPEMKLFRNENFVVEPYHNYWTGIKKIRSPAYLMGYWQSEKYFSDIANTIRQDFTFKDSLSEENTKVLKCIQSGNAISIHVRRGDYINLPNAAATHGSMTIDYYKRAVKYVMCRVGKPIFFIFSDDIQWAKANILIDAPCFFIENNIGNKSFVDMHLMSKCQHHIIANSSFSWWGAWLNSDTNKIVVAPKKWFLIDLDTSDLIPERWVLM